MRKGPIQALSTDHISTLQARSSSHLMLLTAKQGPFATSTWLYLDVKCAVVPLEIKGYH